MTIMENRRQGRDRLLWVALVLALAGCGGGGTAEMGATDYGVARSLGKVYGLYLTEHNGQLPPDEQAFREFVETKQELLENVGLTVDKMFVSPRNGEPLQWVCGKATPPTSKIGMTCVAYEKTSNDGQRLVIGTRGMHETMDEAQFRSLFPDAP